MKGHVGESVAVWIDHKTVGSNERKGNNSYPSE